MNAIIYARFSPRPNAADCDSIEKQVERCAAWCKAKDWELAGTYADAAASGASQEGRPQLEEALLHATKNRAALVCYSLDRLARNTREAIQISERLSKGGAELAILRETVDTSTPTGRLLFTILAALAQLQREQGAERTSQAMRSHIRKGRKMSSQPPYGFSNGTEADESGFKLLVENPEEQAVLARIRGFISAGLGDWKISNRLNREGVKARGYRWNAACIARIRRRYKGGS